MSTDLAALAAETSAQLREIWALIGCAQPEQDAFLTDLTAQVAAVYKDAVTGQEARQKGIESEIESLQATIRSLNAAMGEMEDGIVSSATLPHLGTHDMQPEACSRSPCSSSNNVTC